MLIKRNNILPFSYLWSLLKKKGNDTILFLMFYAQNYGRSWLTYSLYFLYLFDNFLHNLSLLTFVNKGYKILNIKQLNLNYLVDNSLKKGKCDKIYNLLSFLFRYSQAIIKAIIFKNFKRKNIIMLSV